jgi:hypothetical protein
MLKLLRNEPQVEISKPAADMRITDVGICLWKEEQPKFAPQPPKQCAVCGSRVFEEDKRLPALLNPRFEGGFRYLTMVFVHPECFDNCIETSEPEPIPW